MKRAVLLSIAALSFLVWTPAAFAPFAPPGSIDLFAEIGVKPDEAVGGMPKKATMGGTVTDAAKLPLTGMKDGNRVKVASLGGGEFEVKTTGACPVSIRVRLDELIRPGQGLEALGLAEAKALPEGKAVRTTVKDPPRLARRGLVGTKPGDPIDVTNVGGGEWKVATAGDCPDTISVRLAALFRPLPPLAPALVKAGLSADLATLPDGADLIAMVAKPEVLAEKGMKGLTRAGLVLVSKEGAGKWKVTSLARGFPLSIQVQVDEFMELGVMGPRLCTFPKGKTVKAKVVNAKKAGEAGLRGATKGDEIELTNDGSCYRATSLLPENPVTIHLKVDEYF
ncbi:MAG: hypothetical protein ACYTDY_03390 [Planctomycetota bacterium]|jgi:hypothetical protein